MKVKKDKATYEKIQPTAVNVNTNKFTVNKLYYKWINLTPNHF